MSRAVLRSMVLGQVSTNCYFLKNEETQEILIVDPADHPERIQERLQEMQGNPAAILLTHGHFDHIGAVQRLREMYKLPVYAHRQELEMLQNPAVNMTQYYGMPASITPDFSLEDLQSFEAAGFTIQVIHTPGHTAGSCCYYISEEQLLFSGDTLFCESVGRTDFPGGSSMQIRESLHRLLTLPEETKVYPGHSSFTTIGHEKRFNPFV